MAVRLSSPSPLTGDGWDERKVQREQAILDYPDDQNGHADVNGQGSLPDRQSESLSSSPLATHHSPLVRTALCVEPRQPFCNALSFLGDIVKRSHLRSASLKVSVTVHLRSGWPNEKWRPFKKRHSRTYNRSKWNEVPCRHVTCNHAAAADA